jgi:hypothetical protein
LKKMILFLLIALFISLGALFLWPQILVNTRMVGLILDRLSSIEQWSWNGAMMRHKWLKWNKRRFTGHFKDLCLDIKLPSIKLHGCYQMHWDFKLQIGKDILAESLIPLDLKSTHVHLRMRQDGASKEKIEPLDIHRIWRIPFKSYVPDINIHIDELRVETEKKTFNMNISLLKKKQEIILKALDATLIARPDHFSLLIPSPYHLPFYLSKGEALSLKKTVVKGLVLRDSLQLKLHGWLEALEFWGETKFKLPLRHKLDHWKTRKEGLLNFSGELLLADLPQSLKDYGPPPFDKLPAPLTTLKGAIKSKIEVLESPFEKKLDFRLANLIDLAGKDQTFKVLVQAVSTFDLIGMSPEEVVLTIDFQNVAVKLPKLSKKSPPPQLMPDNRIKYSQKQKRKKRSTTKKAISYDLNLVAHKKELKIETNLLDEILRLKFNIHLNESGVRQGFIQVLPLKTKIFKRPIQLQGAKLVFKNEESSLIEAELVFPLPEYKIFLDVEGPISEPKYAFRSEPPLPLPDIYGVLLFGRPMAELNPDDRNSANRTQRVLSQGLLSLSVLYFLAGSPVEYVGYDPDSQQATAQIGLDSKSSLRVGGTGEGVNSTAIRRSLGKGWYLDTSVQNNRRSSNNSEARNYGVLLERIIAY